MKSFNFKYLILLSFILASCGFKVKGELKPVEINVNHRIDFNSLSAYFKDICRTKLTTPGHIPTSQEIDECVSNAVFDFMDAFEAASNGN